MIESATGIILRTRPLTETSLIVHWLTPTSGRISTVAKGVRRPKSPFAGKLDLYYEADFNFTRSRRSELHILREVSLRKTHATLRKELSRLRQVAYAAALIEQTTEVDTPLPEIHALMHGFLQLIPERHSVPQALFAFELKLLSELGQHPNVDEVHLTPGAKALINALGRADWNSVFRLKVSEAQTHELRQYLHGFLIYHLGRIPRGRDAAIAR